MKKIIACFFFSIILLPESVCTRKKQSQTYQVQATKRITKKIKKVIVVSGVACTLVACAYWKYFGGNTETPLEPESKQKKKNPDTVENTEAPLKPKRKQKKKNPDTIRNTETPFKPKTTGSLKGKATKWSAKQKVLICLSDQGYSVEANEGGNNSLFYSIIPQITESDIKRLAEPWKEAPKAQYWSVNAEIEYQASFLRDLAMEFEREIINSLEKGSVPLSDAENKDFVEVLYRTIKEWKGTDCVELRKSIQEKDISVKWNYCKAHFKAYQTAIITSAYPAGQPEALALSDAFKKRLEIFGANHIACEDKSISEQDCRILSYQKKKEDHGIFRIVEAYSNGSHYYCEVSKPSS